MAGQPLLHPGNIHLHMELESQGMLPYAKSLMGGHFRGCQQVRSGRDIKRIPMPMQDGHPLR